MALFMPPGHGGKNRSNPPPLNSFQQEIKAKMKERKKRGLAADVTPSASELESGGELGSDDELMANFNMTSKHETKKKSTSWKMSDSRKSPLQDNTSPSFNRSRSPSDRRGSSPSSSLFGRKTPNSLSEDEDGDELDSFSGPSDLMMTMKRPMKPMDFSKRDATKTMPLLRKSKTLTSVNEDESPREKKWSPPSKHRENEKENQPVRPKSPNVRGRRTPTGLLDSIEEESKPKPSPRIQKRDASQSYSRPVPKPRGRSPQDHISEEESEDEEVMRISQQKAHQNFLKKSRSESGKRTPPEGRRTPSEGRRTPSEGRRTPSEGKRTPSEGKRTPSEGKRTPSAERRSSLDQRRTPSDGRKTPTDGRKTPTDGRKTPTDGRKTPSDGRKTPSDGRKTPETKKAMFGRKAAIDEIFGRKTPTEENKGRKISFDDEGEDGSPKVRRKSVLDMFSSSSKEPKKKPKEQKSRSLLAESDSDSDIGIGAPRQSPVPLVGQRSSEGGSRRGSTERRNSLQRSPAHGGEADYDDTDGFRISHSVCNVEQERASPSYRRPSLRNKDDITNDSMDRLYDQDNMRRPSLKRNEAVDEDLHDEQYGRQTRYEDTSQNNRRSRQRTKQNEIPERDSSVCEDVDKDPTLAKEKQRVKERKLAKTYTATGRMLEEAITSVEDAQNNRMKYIDPDNEAETNNKEVLKKTPKHCPKPRYAKPVINTILSPSSSSVSFNSSTDIRTAVYQEWYKEQLEKAKKELKEKKQKEKELEAKKQKEKEDKILEAKASYQAWLEKKKETLDREMRKKKQKEEEEIRKKQQGELEKKKEAELTFRSWKETKDAYIRKEIQRRMMEEQRKKREEQEKKREKNHFSKRAFEGWKEQKDEKIKTVKLGEKKTKKEKEEEERRAQEERERQALQSYLKWIEKKEHYQDYEYRYSQKQEDFYEPRPAWSPASRTIPVGR